MNETYILQIMYALTSNVLQAPTGTLQAQILAARTLITKYGVAYLRISGYAALEFRYAQQPIIYESTRILTSYLNNTQARSGTQVR